MNKTLLDLEKLKSDWIDSDQSFELLAPGFEDYWEGLARFKTIHSLPKWESFVSAIRGSAVFGKVYMAAIASPAINVAFTLILSTLNAAKPNENDLTFGLMGVESILDDSDRAFIRAKLDENRVILPGLPY